jgi:tetratricopeptide (TPR) repeat protein
LALLVLPVLFLVQSEVADYALQLTIIRDHTAFSQIIRLSGYTVPRGAPRLNLVVPITGEWTVLLGTLRLGWWLTTFGGLAAFVGGFAELRALAYRAPRRWAVVTVAVALFVGLYVGRGVAANQVVTFATNDIRDGDYPAALSHLGVALALNGQLAFSNQYYVAMGRALERVGNAGSPLGLYIHARDLAAIHKVPESIDAFRRAYLANPNDPVIAAAYDSALRKYALSNQNPTMLVSFLSQPGSGSPADAFTIGVLLRRRGDAGGAIPYFRRVLETVSDTDVRSAAYTQIGLCERRLGLRSQARADLLTAIALDGQYRNLLARAAALGLDETGAN